MHDGHLINTETEEEREAIKALWEPVHAKIISAFYDEWGKRREEAKGLDPMVFQRLSVLSTLQIAATLAVDSQMTLPTFLELSEMTYAGAYEIAPKFS